MLKDNLKDIFSGRKFMVAVSFIGLYLLSTGTSWAIFSFIRTKPDVSQDTSQSRGRIDPNLPKTEECPINGKKFSRPERDIWEERRPLTVVIENHADSRPPSGLSFADVVYEAVAEGGITRFLSVFYCGASAQDVRIAPIRSARVYLIDWAAEYGNKPLFVHIGGANNICQNCSGGVKSSGQVAREVDAFRLLERLSWRSPKGNAFDGGTNIGFPVIVRNQYRGTEKALWEHSVEGFTDKIFEEAKTRGFAYRDEDQNTWDENFVKWKFADDKPLDTPSATDISFEFWSNKGEYNVSWKYEMSANRYLRSNGGVSHTDLETKQQISAKNVVIQFVKERGPVDKEGHMFYTTISEGKALIFSNGDIVEATWKKRSQDDRTRFFDKEGKEIVFVRGEIWIEAVPAGNEINY